MTDYQTIAQTSNYIVLEEYQRKSEVQEVFESEGALEQVFIQNLERQGYSYVPEIRSPETMLHNVRLQLETLNQVQFSDEEWARFVGEFLDKPSEGLTEKARKIHVDYIYDFVFDDGRIQNIYLLNKQNLSANTVQVIKQFEQEGNFKNRYDVTILVNGLPLVQVELKKPGVAIREAFNQIHRYSKESFNSEHSLYKFLQLFIISNGSDTRYFANTTQRNQNSFDFTMHWAQKNNERIFDLRDFTATFLQKNVLLKVLLDYSVLNVDDVLMVMRPYQIAAAERILWQINSAYQAKNWGKTESGGYIWHTTGSGKTLTSFKAARLATQLDFIDKVFFVVDRKDLDYQTMKEYQKFSPDSVNGSDSTQGLKRNIAKSDNKIIVTTIQKLNNLMKSEGDLPVYQSQVVFIFDECHRSQFGEAQKNLQKKFRKYYQFGFTGTPIFAGKNALGNEDTQSVFGRQLHSYVITDAIRDDKVLKFKVDYHNVRPQFKTMEAEQDEHKLSALENKEALLHPNRIEEVARYILDNFHRKTHRLQGGNKGFNAMFAVSSVSAAKQYYETLHRLQQGSNKPLRIATIFSFAANEEQSAKGEIGDEGFEISALDSTAKEFLSAAIEDYNAVFTTSFSVESALFQAYYKDLAKRVKAQEVNLLIVVGMFLTGFDAPQLNTLFVDKNLCYHGLIQAYSRTNRIFDATKSFGNIVTFRDLEQDTLDAITLFGQSNTREMILERSFEEYIKGFEEGDSEEKRTGYIETVSTLRTQFADPTRIETEADKKSFVQQFGAYLRLENVLQNFDEFGHAHAFQAVDQNDAKAVADFQAQHFLNDEELHLIASVPVLPPRLVQDYRSKYNDIRDWLRRQSQAEQQEQRTVDWDEVVFEVELLKSQEINLDFILAQIYEHHKTQPNKEALVENIRAMLRSSLDNRAKESLVVEFIQQCDLNTLGDKDAVMHSFYSFARAEQKREVAQLIAEEGLEEAQAKVYIAYSLKKHYASDHGTALNDILPKMSPLNPQYHNKKQTVFEKITALVEKFKRIGGDI